MGDFNAKIGQALDGDDDVWENFVLALVMTEEKFLCNSHATMSS
jgi:hypothetical protein